MIHKYKLPYFHKDWHIATALEIAFSGKRLDIYDIWFILNIYYDGEPRRNLDIIRGENIIYFNLDTLPNLTTVAIYDPRERTLTAQFFDVPLQLRDIEIQIPEGVHELTCKLQRAWLITKEGVQLDRPFKPNLYLEGRTFSTDGFMGWLERGGDEFTYFMLDGYMGKFFTPLEAKLFVGRFEGGTIFVTMNYDYSEKLTPMDVAHFLKLRRGWPPLL